MLNLQEISDQMEIIQVIQRYAGALDKKDFVLLRNVFTADAQLIYVMGEVRVECSMLQADDFFKPRLVKCCWTSHLVSNPLIQLQGDRAHASSRFTATHMQIRDDGSPNTWIVSGHYEDELMREPEGWRIRKRVTNAPYEEGILLTEGGREFKEAQLVEDAD
jgi:3-phenylpropionate/cinnamic acid dioxygenase small subunit